MTAQQSYRAKLPSIETAYCLLKLEVAAGLEPTKIGFADRRLDRFGIATRKRLYPIYTQSCTQTALITPIYPSSYLCNLLKPCGGPGIHRFCRPMPYHLATAPSGRI